MKIVIITHTLHTNYGGLLQAFALQKVLKEMGHDVVTAKYWAKDTISISRRIVYFFYHIVQRYLLGNRRYNPFRYLFTNFNSENVILPQLAVNTDRFIDQHISNIDFFQGDIAPSPEMINKFDAIIVGSDQVWRPIYVHVPSYFLNFTQGLNLKRIAYAASFGTEDMSEFKRDEIVECKMGAQLFDAISVREDSAVTLCREYLGADAEHTLDPTMLLEKEDYIKLLEPQDEAPREKIMMCYVLDKTKEKQAIIDKVATRLGLTPIYVMPSKDYKTEKFSDISECIFPSVSAWIAGFRDAEYVVTDSFHGTVFSIIFNKPFVAINNAHRGSSRFDSLLKIFSLQERLVSSVDEIVEPMFDELDYTHVNSIKAAWQARSMKFLKDNL